MCYSATAIANYFIQETTANDELLTNLRLQKILYFAHATYYKKNHKRLFDDPIVAWFLGPVVPSVYYAVKSLGTNVITDLLTVYDQEKGICIPVVRPDDADIKEHLSQIKKLFEHVTTSTMVALSHQPDGAWFKTLKDKGIDPTCEDLSSRIPRNLTILDADIETLGK
ncbi:MAG: DUF4065 domain-containing protein [Victivallales bacterium]|nr:DUF4065 domain-containing protein [Victivallales bacterium]